MDEANREKISTTKNAKEAWEILQQAYGGAKKKMKRSAAHKTKEKAFEKENNDGDARAVMAASQQTQEMGTAHSGG